MKKVGIAACSNGLEKDAIGEIQKLQDFLKSQGRESVCSSCIYCAEGPYSGTGRQRAEALMKLYSDPQIEDIFDVSGGDMANEILDFLDYDKIQSSRARLWGYSDLTAVLNAIYAKTGKPGVLYSPRNLVRGDCQEQQRQWFTQGDALFSPQFQLVQGEKMEGIVVGGNIRCFLKLAGTSYFPELKDRVLLLEARSGKVPQMVAYLSQLRSCGAFRKVSGILLGTFTQMEKEGSTPEMLTLVKEFAGPKIPIAITRDIGHGPDSRAILIGGRIHLEKSPGASSDL